jgi:nucleotide-binding universal stress UspA family protein
MFNTILVAVDESEAANAAFDLALRMARSEGDKLILVNVLDVAKLVAVAGYEAPYPIDAIAMMKESSEQLLADAKATADKAGVPAETFMVEGDTCDEILRVAKEQNAGLICIGTHGRKGLSRLFLGSVAEGVLRNATVPVLAIRPTKAKTAAGTSHPAGVQAAS